MTAWHSGERIVGPVQRVPARDVLERRAAAADRPGEHLWVISAAWRISDPAAISEGALMDAESLIMLSGPGCLKCEQAYSRRLTRQRCPDRPVP